MAALLLFDKKVEYIIKKVSDKWFYSEKNKAIYNSMCSLFNKNFVLTLDSIINSVKLKADYDINEIEAILQQIATIDISPFAVDPCINSMKNDFQRRELSSLLTS